MKALAEWLRTQGASFPVRTGEMNHKSNELPHRLITLYPTGGPGLTMEGLFDTRTFQVKVRGSANDYDGAEREAERIDKILTATHGVKVDGKYVLRFDRAGGPPVPDNPDKGDRVIFVCNYIVQFES